MINSIRKAMLLAGVSMIASGVSATDVRTDNVDVRFAGGFLTVNADLVLDDVKLKSNHQVFVTPVITSLVANDTTQITDTIHMDLPSVLVSGRNMHLSYLRGVLNKFPAIKRRDIMTEVERKNGKQQTVAYSSRIQLEPWMKSFNTSLAFVYDSCGCGTSLGQRIGPDIPIFENPIEHMTARLLPAPSIEIPWVDVHEGRSRVQFEVDRTVLHDSIYRCRNGQQIDNRAQLRMIDDSVHYALTDPNVEIEKIVICGYASPESPYLHNDELATGRSKALAEYLADRYNLPRGSVKYSAVPENWVEFREEVLMSNEISEEERKLLLELIDAPATTPEEFDAKERMLKTDKRYKKLFYDKILPQWFPRYRATTFAIYTKLKPFDDQQLAEVIKTSPEKMSLNQMMRVADLYDPGSQEFKDVIEIALRQFPKDEIAVTNAATMAILDGDYERANELLKGVPESPAVLNLLGIIATAEERYDAAESFFKKSGTEEALRNLEFLK